MATNNSINNTSNPLSSTAVTVDPAASADSYVQYSISSTAKFRVGVDQSASDSYKISQGNALGTNDTFVITSAGEITEPLQPAFLAYNSATDTNATGNAVTYTVICDSEVYDQNSDYNNGTGIFTAPVTGRYAFNSTIRLSSIGASNTTAQFALVASNRTMVGQFNKGGGLQNAGGELSYSVSTYVDMDAADTARIQITVVGGTQTVGVVGDSVPNTWFSGYLAV